MDFCQMKLIGISGKHCCEYVLNDKKITLADRIEYLALTLFKTAVFTSPLYLIHCLALRPRPGLGEASSLQRNVDKVSREANRDILPRSGLLSQYHVSQAKIS